MLSNAILRLFSPLLPIGGFTYSQGIEAVVENHIISDANDCLEWIKDILLKGLSYNDLPILIRLYDSIENGDIPNFKKWCNFAIATRTTKEFRLEECQKGKALVSVMSCIGVDIKNIDNNLIVFLNNTYLGSLAFAAQSLGIQKLDLLQGYIFSYIEGIVMAGTKTIPLGQNKAWQIITYLSSLSQEVIDIALDIEDDDIGSSLPNMAIHSSLHEVMYTRIYRN
ncbi:MAG: urease accessory protein UreF [Succinivibrionaceae bacterium]